MKGKRGTANPAPFEQRYKNAVKALYEDQKIAQENRTLFQRFFTEAEHTLKRRNQLRALDDRCYKTLYYYITKLRTVNAWFQNKPWEKLTEDDIERTYNALEDGHILRENGKPYEPHTYYTHVILSRPFELAGAKTKAENVIKFRGKKKKPVRFITEEDFRRIAEHPRREDYRLLLWLAFDIGENVSSLLRLSKDDFTRHINESKEPEYHIRLRQDMLKRSRRERTEITNYRETVDLLDSYLSKLQRPQLFNFGYNMAKRALAAAVKYSGVVCIPNKEPVTWKDLRSSMACTLLKKGWSRDEVNARLGHVPSSGEIDAYINYLAIDRHKPKQKVHQYEMAKLQEELQRQKEQNKLYAMRQESLQQQMEQQAQEMQRIAKIFTKLQKMQK